MDAEKYLCGRCLEELTEPRMLACLHTFCTNCLQAQLRSNADTRTPGLTRRLSEDQMRNDGCSPVEASYLSGYETDSNYAEDGQHLFTQTVYCSTCGLGTRLPNGDVRHLPINHTIQPKLLLSKRSLPSCQLCSLDSLACNKCEDCNIVMCSACSETHTNWESTIHSLVPLKDSSKKMMNQAHPVCELHRGEEYAEFCGDCGVLVCQECRSGPGLHWGHRTEPLPQAARRQANLLRRALEAAHPRLKEALRTAEATRRQEDKIKEKCKEVENEVEFHIQSYHDALEDHRQSLLGEIAQVQENKLEAINDHLSYLEQKAKNTETAMNYAEDILKETSEVKLLNVATLVLERLEWCGGCPTEQLSLNIPNCLQFLPHERSTSIKSHQLYGMITTQSVCPAYCYIKNEGSLLNCRQHKKVEVVLVTQDCNKQTICHGGEKIIAELRYRDSSQRSLPISVCDEADGTYTLSFTPDSPGNLSLGVLVHNEHIQGSPYKVTVFTFQPHSGVFHCCTFCSSGGSKNVICGCGGKIPGGYKGCGHGHIGHPGRRHWSCCGNVLQNSECNRPIVYQFSL